MGKKIISILAVLLMFIGSLSVPVAASGTTLNLSAATAAVGEMVTASGTSDADTWIAVKVLDGTGNILFLDFVKSETDGSYSCAFTVPAAPSGILRVIGGYGSNVATAGLAIVECHTVAVSANPAAGGTAAGGGTYSEGSSVTVTAAANSNYTFVNWTEGGSPVSTSTAYTFTLGTSDRTLTANFAVIPGYYTVSIGTLTGGSITASPTSATAGTTINLTITPDLVKQLKAGTLKYNDGTTYQTISGTSFSMPAANVMVTAEFEAATHVVLDNGGTNNGQVQLPAGTTNLQLGDSSILDLSNGVQTATGGDIIVGGQSQNLSSFIGGSLSNVDLTVAQNVGGQAVQVEKAVRLVSGTNDQPITITNSGLAGVSASIPDGTTILAPAGWNGSMTPPRQVSGTGSAPSGFSVGNTVIEVGAANTILLFDKPVTLIIPGVTGPVGYKPAGSNTWVQITQQAGVD
ncbi:MAG: hypothetical protein APF81_08015 [Desulfosporosinus sp. BRH_c37]|nr:MAG: hypothetical protein APF81_08015 [Desulfosporosinus sp. BRH_c37]